MMDLLDNQQQALYKEFLQFAKLNVEPYANSWDKEENIPKETIKICAEEGYLGGMIPVEYSGRGWDNITYGVFSEAIGRSSISLSGLFNVHTMIAQTILKWGTEEQKQRWLSQMAKGELIGAFALTEPGAGSDVQGIETEYRMENNNLVLNGKKRWITFGAMADIILVFGKIEGKPVAYIVEKGTPGFTITPVTDMLGFRAAHLAVLQFDNCIIKKENVIGKENFALSYIAPYALEFGRISVAFASLGLLRGCIEICGNHVLERKAFGHYLIDHGTIREMIADMGVDYEAAKFLCHNCCKAKNENMSDATEKVMIAKYFTTRAAVRHSANAVQIMGALGCNESFSVSRYYRDSKTMEIIEGSNEIHQMILGKSFARQAKRAK